MTNDGHAARSARAGSVRRAAGLTLHLVPCVAAVLAGLASLLGLLGDHPGATRSAIDVLADTTPATPSDLDAPVADLMRNDELAAVLLVGGLLGTALFSWSYLRALRRLSGASTRGRRRPRPAEALLDAGARIVIANLLVICALGALATGPVAGAIGDAAGIGDRAILAWDLAKWPLLLAAVTWLVTVVRGALSGPRALPTLRAGQVAAAAAWCVAVPGFAVYVASVEAFKDTYGSVGTGVVLLMWVTLFSLLYYATPDMRIPGPSGAAKGAATPAAAWVATGAALALWSAGSGSIGAPYWAPGAVALVAGGLWAANVALLRSPHPAARPSVGNGAVVQASRADIAHRHLVSVLESRAGSLSDREAAMLDWGFAFGQAWAIERKHDPATPEEVSSARALESATVMFKLRHVTAPAPNGPSNGHARAVDGHGARRIER